jgi:UDP-glucose 4-epimerase
MSSPGRCGDLPVVVLDDLSTGDPARLPPDVPLVVAPVQDRAAVLRTLREFAVRGVVHLAARKSVPESIRRPGWYHAQNVGGLASVLDAMAGAGVHRIVYSSSAAVYGNPTGRVTEDSPTRPVNPYGLSKLLGEQLLRATACGTPLSWVALRYFNVAGCADPWLADRIGGNLIPLALTAIRTGVPLTVTGVDHPTLDGSGVRDYVHVLDVAGAHLAAVRRLDPAAVRRLDPAGSGGGGSVKAVGGTGTGTGRAGCVFNVGTGRGYSVLQVLSCLSQVAGVAVPQQPGPRRPGDPAEVVADVARIRRRLGWRARHDLTGMLASAWHAASLSSRTHAFATEGQHHERTPELSGSGRDRSPAGRH